MYSQLFVLNENFTVGFLELHACRKQIHQAEKCFNFKKYFSIFQRYKMYVVTLPV